MSHASPQPDTGYLNDFFSKEGKKNLKSEEFQTSKLNKIIVQLAQQNPAQAELSKAYIEMYYNRHDFALEVLRKALATYSDNHALRHALLIASAESADFVELFKDYESILQQSSKSELSTVYDDIFRHAAVVYLYVESYTQPHLKAKLKDNDITIISQRFKEFADLGISLSVYRKFVSIIYKAYNFFYAGSMELKFKQVDSDFVIRIETVIHDADDLFEFNNHLQNQIMQWYSEAPVEEQMQIEKVVVYAKEGQDLPQVNEGTV